MPPKKAKKGQEDEEWEVERVLDRRTESDGSFRYFTKWKKCPASENSWEPRSSFGSDAWKVEELDKILAGELAKPKWRTYYEKSLNRDNEVNDITKNKSGDTNKKDVMKKPAKTPGKKKLGRPPKTFTSYPKSPAKVKSAPVASPAFHLLVGKPVTSSSSTTAPRRRTQTGDGLGTSEAAATPRKRTRSSDDRGAIEISGSPRKFIHGSFTGDAGGLQLLSTLAIDPHHAIRQGIPSPSQVQVSPKSPRQGVSRRSVGDEEDHRELLREIDGDDDGLLEESPSIPEGQGMEDEEVEEDEQNETTLSMSSNQSPPAIANGPSPSGFNESPRYELAETHRKPSASIANGPSTSGITESNRIDPTMVSPSESTVARPTSPKKDKKHLTLVTARPTMVGKPPMNSIGKLRTSPGDKKRAREDSSDPDYDGKEEIRAKVHRRAPRRVASAVVLPAAIDSEDEEERELRASGRRVALTKVSFDGYPKRVLSQETGSHSVYFNTKCSVGPNCHRSLFSALPNQIEGLRLTQLWQSVLIRLIESSREQEILMEAVLEHQGEPKQYPSVAATFAWGGCTQTIFLAPPSDFQEANNTISAILTSVGMCANAIRFGTQMACSRCAQE